MHGGGYRPRLHIRNSNNLPHASTGKTTAKKENSTKYEGGQEKGGMSYIFSHLLLSMLPLAFTLFFFHCQSTPPHSLCFALLSLSLALSPAPDTKHLIFLPSAGGGGGEEGGGGRREVEERKGGSWDSANAPTPGGGKNYFFKVKKKGILFFLPHNSSPLLFRISFACAVRAGEEGEEGGELRWERGRV